MKNCYNQTINDEAEMRDNMERIIFFDHDIENIGLNTRKSTPGEEIELVKEFIEYYIHNFLRKSKVNNLAVFVEPQVASGFPDIVFATYSSNILDNWSAEREKLDTYDLKVLSHLLLTKGCTGGQLITGLKLSEKSTVQSLERLLDAHMIRRANGLWKPLNQNKIYNIKKLISVEAKVGDMKKVAEQSLINTWFASQSYALTSTTNPQSSTINNFQRQGTGLYCKRNGFKKVVEAKKMNLPSSYLSLQFNEWIAKAMAY